MRVFELLIISIFVLSSCGSNGSQEKHDNNVNKHMYETSFQELVDRFNDTNRYLWQKPDLVINKLGDLQNKNVADIGSGTGYFAFKLAEQGARVLAVDVDQRFIDYMDSAKSDFSINTKLIPYDNPKLDSSFFDYVITVNTYHHIENRISYFREVWKGLKPGAKLMVVDFKKKKTIHGPPENLRIHGFEVMRELQAAGFSKVIIDVTSLEEQYIILAKKFDIIT